MRLSVPAIECRTSDQSAHSPICQVKLKPRWISKTVSILPHPQEKMEEDDGVEFLREYLQRNPEFAETQDLSQTQID